MENLTSYMFFFKTIWETQQTFQKGDILVWYKGLFKKDHLLLGIKVFFKKRSTLLRGTWHSIRFTNFKCIVQGILTNVYSHVTTPKVKIWNSCTIPNKFAYFPVFSLIPSQHRSLWGATRKQGVWSRSTRERRSICLTGLHVVVPWRPQEVKD